LRLRALIRLYSHDENCSGPYSLPGDRVNNIGTFNIGTFNIGTYVGSCDNDCDRTGLFGILKFW